MKRNLLGIIIGIISFGFANAQEFVVDGLRYYSISKSEASFVGIDDTTLFANETSLVIPNSVKPDIKTISIVSIRDNALSGFDQFEEITLPSNLTSIGDSAFKNCTKLKTISFPSVLSYIGSGAFKGCSGLEKFDLSSTSISQIKTETFYGCSSLDSLFIPKKISYLYDSAFAYCGIRYLELEYCYRTIYSGVFAGCKNLETVVFPENTPSLGDGTFADCSGLKRFHIPESVSTITAGLFKNCSSLDSLEIHSKVYTIRTDAFDGCENLKTIFNKSSLNLVIGATTNGKVAYYAEKIISADFVIDGIGYKLISVNGESKAEVCDGGSEFVGDIVIPDSVTFNGKTYDVYSIGSDAFANATKLVSVKLPNTVKVINTGAFKNSSLEEIDLGESLKNIYAYAFQGCKNLTSITLPTSLENIAGISFYECDSLKKVINHSYLELTQGGTSYGEVAKNAEVLINTHFIILDDLKYCVISENAVELRSVTSKETTITVPDKVTIADVTYNVEKIASSAFKGKTYLTSITLPSTLETIGSEAFSGCSKLDSLTIPSKVKTIETKAFFNCSKLQNIVNLSELEIHAGSEDNGYVAYYTKIVSGNKYLFVLQDDNNIKIPFYEIDSIGVSKEDVASAKFMESFVNASYNKCPDNLSDAAYFYIWCKNQTIKLKADGTTALFADDYKANIITAGQEEVTVDGYDYVDLGLPSGIKWATVNYGASCPVGAGEFLLYETVLSLNEDSYTVPDNDDVTELIDNCRWILFSYDRFDNGYYMVIGPNGNHIILPTTGDYTDYDGNGNFMLSGTNQGLYWSIYDKNNKCASAKWQAYDYSKDKWFSCYNSSSPDDNSKRPVRFILKK